MEILRNERPNLSWTRGKQSPPRRARRSGLRYHLRELGVVELRVARSVPVGEAPSSNLDTRSSTSTACEALLAGPSPARATRPTAHSILGARASSNTERPSAQCTAIPSHRPTPSSSTSTSRIARPGPGPRPLRLPRASSGAPLRARPRPRAAARSHRLGGSAALAEAKRHFELDHDEEIWVLFTERIIVGMGVVRPHLPRGGRDGAPLGPLGALRALRGRGADARRASPARPGGRAALELVPGPRGVHAPPRARPPTPSLPRTLMASRAAQCSFDLSRHAPSCSRSTPAMR